MFSRLLQGAGFLFVSLFILRVFLILYSMFHVIIIAVGKIRNSYFAEAIDEYLKRIRPFAKVEVIEVPASSFKTEGEIERAKEKEGVAIREVLMKRTGKIYLLDEGGREFDSPGFHKLLSDLNEPLLLVISGTAGVSNSLKKEYPTLSLSRLTLPHELARVVLVEQLYRAVTMGQKRNKYHY